MGATHQHHIDTHSDRAPRLHNQNIPDGQYIYIYIYIYYIIYIYMFDGCEHVCEFWLG
jgi:hypothetical protein